MGMFVNPDNSAFQVALNSEIYVDKTGIIKYTNRVLNTLQGYICNSRPRRFGKSITANMLTAYYSRGCDSEAMFADLEISKNADFKKHLNQYDVIHLDTLCERYGQDFEEVRRWYDGYQLGKYHVYNPNAVVNLMFDGDFQSYWSGTASYEAIVPLINMDFDGLKGAIIEMLSGDRVPVDVTSFQNDTNSFANKDDVITYLIHLGYLGYDQKLKTAFVPNEEIRQELIRATKRKKWNELVMFQQESEQLLNRTLAMDGDAVAKGIKKIHMDYASSIQYNNENSLSSVLSIAYLSAMQYYFKPIREMPAGNGFADFVFIPKPEYSSFYPALVVELKWNKDVTTALKQIKDKRYPESILNYTGDILLVGINYNKGTKEHQCLIEKYEKD